MAPNRDLHGTVNFCTINPLQNHGPTANLGELQKCNRDRKRVSKQALASERKLL